MVKVLRNKVSKPSYNEIVEMTNDEIVELLKSGKENGFIVSPPGELTIKNIGQCDLEITDYDGYIE